MKIQETTKNRNKIKCSAVLDVTESVNGYGVIGGIDVRGGGAKQLKIFKPQPRSASSHADHLLTFPKLSDHIPHIEIAIFHPSTLLKRPA